MSTLFRSAALWVAAFAVSASAFAATPKVNAQIAPGEIALGEAAQLTLTVLGNGEDENLAPPAVPGLEFALVGQSSQISSINGATTSTTVLTYEVTPQHAGDFTIPAFGGGAHALVFHVRPGSAPHRTAQANPGTPNLPPPVSGKYSAAPTHLSKDGSAFARMLLPKRELFVGETVPVEIQVGLRAEMVASLNGLPALNGDAFTLNKLSAKPEQTEKTVNGQKFTLLTWRSVLTAIKPGGYALTIETPLTVRVQTEARHAHLSKGLFDDSMFDDMMDDTMLQNFFGGTTEKEITVTSDPDALKVVLLPSEGRPDGFSGAVGEFEAGAELSSAQSAAGDPLTLRLKVTGNGSFDRVNAAMLSDGNGWKTYKPSAKFTPADSVGFGGEKIFEQAVIPTQPGAQTIPALSFSFFNPDTRRYETKHTLPINMAVSPAAPAAVSTTAASSASSNVAPLNEPPKSGLRPDQTEFGTPVATLQPLFFQGWFLACATVAIGVFAGLWTALSLREKRAKDTAGVRRRQSSRVVEQFLAAMDAAANAGDSHAFFQAARAAFQQKLALLWNAAPETITIAELDAKPGACDPDVRRIFALADESAYSGQRLSTADIQQWKQSIVNLLEKVGAPCIA